MILKKTAICISISCVAVNPSCRLDMDKYSLKKIKLQHANVEKLKMKKLRSMNFMKKIFRNSYTCP